MTLDEIRTLLDLRDNPDQSCIEVNDLLDRHIADVNQRITALTSLESQLRQLRSQCCETDATRSCAILNALGSS